MTLTGVEAVVVFDGSRSEKLGKGDNLFGEGAQLADVTVYGPGGADDIQNYKGFTMSSDFEKYGAIADGEYNVNYDQRGKSGSLKSNWAVNARGKVPVLGGVNPSPYADYRDAKVGIFIHSSNANGFAGNYFNKEGKSHGISEGCLLITPTQYDLHGNVLNIGWSQFNKQLQKVSNFLLRLQR